MLGMLAERELTLACFILQVKLEDFAEVVLIAPPKHHKAFAPGNSDLKRVQRQ